MAFHASCFPPESLYKILSHAEGSGVLSLLLLENIEVAKQE
jgi:type III secretory pathway lipoprotein EscJ